MTELLEREREIAAVEALLGHGSGLLVIEGGAGLGKTSLVHAACGRAQALGYQVLRARGVDLEADSAFGVVRQLFERRLASVGGDERETLLVGPAATIRPLLLERFAEILGLRYVVCRLARTILAGRQPLGRPAAAARRR